MKATLAVISALLVFLVVWILVAALIAGVSWAATYAGVRPGIFLLVNVLLVWVLSPSVGAGVAIYAMTEKFSSVDPKTIFVGFVSVCGVLLTLIILFEFLIHLSGNGSVWKTVLLLAQGLAIFVGAKIGSFFSSGIRAN